MLTQTHPCTSQLPSTYTPATHTLVSTFHSNGLAGPHLFELGEPVALPDGDHHALPVKVLQVEA